MTIFRVGDQVLLHDITGLSPEELNEPFLFSTVRTITSVQGAYVTVTPWISSRANTRYFKTRFVHASTFKNLKGYRKWAREYLK